MKEAADLVVDKIRKASQEVHRERGQKSNQLAEAEEHLKNISSKKRVDSFLELVDFFKGLIAVYRKTGLIAGFFCYQELGKPI